MYSIVRLSRFIIMKNYSSNSCESDLSNICGVLAPHETPRIFELRLVGHLALVELLVEHLLQLLNNKYAKHTLLNKALEIAKNKTVRTLTCRSSEETTSSRTSSILMCV